ncbi:hypothetical protein GY45DRAFT_451709 [Cubamyces sp. BRFM 1775]|nr:hypothetical protein GY45DRAFT_451709 [Cubamyces sp. BRFM 1775]
MRDLSERFTPGIIERICRVLIFDQDSDGDVDIFVGPRTVTAIALTCKRFSPPALRVLWRTVPDPALLLYTLPRTLSHAEQSRRCPVQYALTDGDVVASCLTPGQGNLERLLEYACRVRAVDQSSAPLPLPLTLDGFSGFRSFYKALRYFSGNLSVFPEMRKLRLCASGRRLPCCALPLLVGPKTRHVDLEVSSKHARNRFLYGLEEDHDYVECTDDFIKFADSLAAAKWLNYLRIDIECVYVRSSMDIFTMSIRRLPYLTELVVTSPLTLACMVDLAELPLLQYLTCTLDDNVWDDDDIRRYLDNDRPFMRLIEGNLTVPNLALVASVLSPVSTPELMILRVKTTGRVQRGEVDMLFRTIVKSPARRASVGTIDIQVEDVFEPGRSGEEGYTSGHTGMPALPKPINEATLAPLFELEDLTTLSLRIRWPFDIDNGLLEKIADAWGMLFHLHLSGGYPRGVFHKPAQGDEDGDVTMRFEGEDAADDDDNATSQAGKEILCANRVQRIWTILPKPRLTLFGLVPLLRACNDIETLSVQFDATRQASIPPLEHALFWSVANMPPRGVYKLSVGLSPIQRPYGVAELLSTAFPKLTSVYSGWWALQTDEERALDAGPQADGWDSSDDDEHPDDFVAPFVWAKEDEGWSMARRYYIRWRTVGALLKQYVRMGEGWARKAEAQRHV